MRVRRIDHIGIIVYDLEAAKDFFVAFGLVVHGEAQMGGRWWSGCSGWTT